MGYLPQLVEGRDLAESFSKHPKSSMGQTSGRAFNTKDST